MEHIFLTTRKPENIYQYIIGLCLNDLRNSYKKKLTIKKIKVQKIPDLFFLLICLKYLINGSFFNKSKTATLTYKKINFGTSLITLIYNNFDTYNSSVKYYYYLLKNLYFISKIFKTAFFYEKNYQFKYAYIDHITGINSIFYNVFKNKKRIFYTNRHPNNICKTKSRNYDEINRVNHKKKIFSKIYKRKILKTAKNIFESIQNTYYWMEKTNWSSYNFNDLKKYEYIIYAHTFTDTQLEQGYDGFISTLEWLKFTIDELLKKKVKFIVKAHPNFYKNVTLRNQTNKNVAKWDNKLYQNLIKKYKNEKNILFINKPILNKHLVKKLNSKCIAITKFGSAQLEMIHFGFKVIASSKNTIDPKFSLYNSWENKKKYREILNKKWKDLKFANKNNYITVLEYLFLNQNSNFGKNFYLNVLRDHMTKLKLVKKNSPYDKIVKEFNNFKDKSEILKSINIPIEEV